VAKWTGALVLVAIVVRDARRRDVALTPHGARLRRLGTAAAPLFVRTVALRVAFAIATAAAAHMPGASLAAYAIAAQIWLTLAYLIDGLEVAGQALVGHSLGAADVPGARAVGARILLWAVVVGTVAGAIVVAVRQPLASVFTDDADVAAAAAASLLWVGLTQPLCAVTYALDGILVGAGDLWFMAGAMVVATAMFAPAAWWVGATAGTLGWLWAALAGFMAVRGAALGGRFAWSRWEPAGSPALVTRSSPG
jgi:Na+-driven multidrug efflux pump